MLEKGKDYSVEEFLKDQMVYLYEESRKEDVTIKEKIDLSLAMTSIYRELING